MMEHIVYVDAQAKEMEKLLAGSKTMIVRGAAGRKMPYGRVKPGDMLYFVRNNGEGTVQACARVRYVYDSDPLAPQDSLRMLQSNQPKAQLTDAQIKRWACKRYLVFVEVATAQAIEPLRFDRSDYNNMDDWLPVGSIASVQPN